MNGTDEFWYILFKFVCALFDIDECYKRKVNQMEDMKTFFELTDNDKIMLAERYAPKPQTIPNIRHIPKGYFCKADDFIAVMRPNGTVDIAMLDFNGAISLTKTAEAKKIVSQWRDIDKISCGKHHLIALKKDGTVLSFGNNLYGQCNVRFWRNICNIFAGDDCTVGMTYDGELLTAHYIPMVSAGGYHTVGLNSYGHVEGIGYNYNGQCLKLPSWEDIIYVSAGTNHTLGLKGDGTVAATGSNMQNQCEVDNWKNIIAISAGEDISVGLKHDGTVLTAGRNSDGQCNVSEWRNIRAVSAKYKHTVGLKYDGTVVATGNNKHGQCNVDDWRNIIAVSAGGNITVGLKNDGTAVSVGYDYKGRYKLSDWDNLVQVSAGYNHIVGLKADGTVIAAGNNDSNQCNVKKWTDIIFISAGRNHTVGMKSDGTVLATGGNDEEQCKVETMKLMS